jgi:tetratricopeptide (TPR) repeat protein/TolB-like protein
MRPTVPEGLSHAVDRILAKAPVDRYQTADELAIALAAEQVSLVTPSGGVTPTDTPAVGAGGRRSGKLRIGVAAAAVFMAVMAVLLLPRSSGGAFNPNKVLVVALADESGLEESEALGRLAQTYIIQVLTDAGFAEVVDPVAALAVSQNVAAEGMATGPEDVLALADEAGAGTIVSGSLYTEGDSVHVQTRITDARDGSVLETVGPIVGSLGAPSELVARLAGDVVVALASLLDHELGSWEPRTQPATLEAYEAYNEGLEAFLRNEMVEAGGHFERAAASDPTFYRAALSAALCYRLVGPYEKSDSLIAKLVESRDRLSAYERCRLDYVTSVWGPKGNSAAAYDAARCMLQASPGSDDAKRTVAIHALWLNRPGETVERLKELDPNRGLISRWDLYWAYLASAYHVLGDHESELDVVRQGQQRFPEKRGMIHEELRPLAALGRIDDIRAHVAAVHPGDLQGASWWVSEAGQELRAHGHHAAARELFDEAISMYESAVADTEQSPTAPAPMLYQAERWDDARRLCEEGAQEFPEDGGVLYCVGALAARRGDRETAMRMSMSPQLHPLNRARIAALLGDREEAMTFIRQAIDHGFQFGYALWLHQDIDFESLRDYPPFQELMRPKG